MAYASENYTDTAGGTYLVLNTTTNGTIASAERIRISDSGNVGIGTTSPASTLDVNGAITQRGMSAPSVSSSGQGVIYFDSTANKFKVSENGGAYADLVSAGGGGGSGTVTSVALSLPSDFSVSGSPVTSSGTLTATWASQSNNNVFAAPINGTSGTPSFRRLGIADIRSTVNPYGTFFPTNCTSGETLVWSSPTDQMVCTALSVSASNFSSQTANTVLAAPDGSNGTPSFRALAATDLPTVTVAKGGTGATTQAGAANAVLPTQSGNPGKYLTTDGTNVSWANAPSGSSQWTTTGSNIYYSTGKVGIGTSAPTAPLEIQSSASNDYALRIVPSTGTSKNRLVEIHGNNDTSNSPMLAISMAPTTGWVHNTLAGSFIYSSKNGTGTAQPLYLMAGSSIASQTPQITLTTAGNVGINASSPSSLLHLASTATGTAGTDVFRLYDSGGTLRTNITSGGAQAWQLSSATAESGRIAYTTPGGSPGIVIWTGPSTSLANRVNFLNYGTYFSIGYDADSDGGKNLNIAPNGKVGVGGATAPNSALDINGAMTMRGMSAPSAAPAGQGLIYFDSTANKFKVSQNGGSYTDLITAAGGGSSQWTTSGSDIYFTAGNVGIGYDTPGTTKLYVANNNSKILMGTDSGGQGDAFFNVLSANGKVFTINAYGGGTNLISDIGTNYAINTSNGTQGLVPVGAKKAPFIRMSAEDGSVSLYGESGSGANYRNVTSNIGVYVKSNGNVAIGSSSPSYKLDVAGDINTSSCFRVGATTIGGTCTSDIRLKENIRDYTEGLDQLLSIRLHTYQFNGLGEMPKTGEIAVGVIAQEVEKTNPDLVKTLQVKMHPDDKMKTEIKAVDYSKFTYMLINAVKEIYHQWLEDSYNLHQLVSNLQIEVDNKVDRVELEKLQKENQQLSQENQEMKQRLDRIEKILQESAQKSARP